MSKQEPSTPRPDRLKDPIRSANSAGLRYVTDQMPGITREARGKSFEFRYPIGETVRDEEVLGRLKSLAIPPAWTEVWICPDPCGHLQATGRDARGRKQHRYHPQWRQVRDENKFSRMMAFGRALPGIRRHLDSDLRLKGLPRRKVVAAVVRLLEVSLIRVGNDEYARHNDSFGLTTMQSRHAQVRRGAIRFHFRGKSGKVHDLDIRDHRLARIVRHCQDLPGQELFAYYDEDCNLQDVKSSDVNDYLREVTGRDFTAKDFRTWAGTVLAAVALREFLRREPKAQKKNLVRAIESVAEKLGNTPSICRKCYVHPEVINAYLDGSLVNHLKKRAARELRNGQLPPEEAAVLRLLRTRLKPGTVAGGEGLQTQLRESLRQAKRRVR